jgi:hypothetical protein
MTYSDMYFRNGRKLAAQIGARWGTVGIDLNQDITRNPVP